MERTPENLIIVNRVRNDVTCVINRKSSLFYVAVIILLLVRVAEGLLETEDIFRAEFREGTPHAWAGALVDEASVPEIRPLDVKTMIVLIRPAVAVGVAADIATYNPIREQAMFLSEQPFFCLVRHYLVHAQHARGVATVALVYMSHFDPDYVWNPVHMVPWGKYPHHALMVGLALSENDKVYEFYEKMTLVDDVICIAFYITHQISSVTAGTGGARVLCYGEPRHRYVHCTRSAGLALTEHGGRGGLLGLSLEGPGCAAPSRFLDLRPLLPWLLQHSGPSRRFDPDNKPPDFRDDVSYYGSIISDHLTDKYKKKHNLYAIGIPPKGHYPHGVCLKRTFLEYQEYSDFYSNKPNNIATYALSVYSSFVPNFECIEILVQADYQSETHIWYDVMDNDYTADRDISKYIKIVPTESKSKILILNDEMFKKPKFRTNAMIVFRFHYDFFGRFTVKFYGQRGPKNWKLDDHVDWDRQYKLMETLG